MEGYEAYIDSGIEWIGKVPAGWDVPAAKRYVLITNGSDPLSEGDTPVYGSSGVSFKTCGEAKQAPAVLLGRKGTIDSPSYIDHPYWNVDTAFDVKAASEVMSLRYYYYLANCFDYARYQTSTAVPSMTQTDYGNMRIPLPSSEEQQSIADYLDAKTAEIDALVADCEREVGLLREYRKAVISEAVTKGLDPDAPMKDSGIEWIGEIPEGWHCAKLGLISVSTLGRMLDTEKQTGDCLAPYLSNRDVQWFRIDESDLKEMDFPFEMRGSYEIHDGDVLICEGGEVGRCAVWHGTTPAFYFQKAIHRVRFDTSVMDPDYASYQMFQKAQVSMFREVRKGESTIGHLPGDQLRQLTFVVPPLDEQCAIVAYLNAKTTEIGSLIDAKQSMADKLREYRKSLISEAVTGKFKVPGDD